VSSNFYVYEHWRPDNGTCFYVGKGYGSRAFVLQRRNPHHQNVIDLLIKIGAGVGISFVKENLTEKEAFKEEVRRISYWKKIDVNLLVNMSDGGEGQSGFVHSYESKLKMSENCPMKRQEVKEKISGENNPMQDQETRAKWMDTWIKNSDSHFTTKSRVAKERHKKGTLGRPTWPKSSADSHRRKVRRAMKEIWDKMTDEQYFLRCEAIGNGRNKNVR
jgi:hypothetical protein